MDSLLLIGAEGAEIRRLKSHLLKRGFQVKVVPADHLEGLEEGKGKFLLGVLDAAGPERLADLVRKVRESRPCKELPLVALIKEAHLKDLGSVRGLEDFVTFPSAPELVEVRVRFVLSRLNHLAPGGGMRVGALELDVDRYEVSLEGEPLELTYKEFELLKFLSTHPGRVFSRDQLLNQVWGYNFIGGTRTVDVHVRRLRAKLGPKHASLIDTVRNVGYKFLERL